MASTEIIRMEFAVAPPGGFASSYDKAVAGNFAFLIPGDETLFIGGGALNGAVGKLLLEEAGQPIPFDRNADGTYKKVKDASGKDVVSYDRERCTYMVLHQALFEHARRQAGRTFIANRADIEKSRATVQFAAARTYSDSPHTFGAVFLSVFTRTHRPYNEMKNVGVLYAVGPLGINARAEGEAPPEPGRQALVKTDPAEFLAEIYKMAMNAIQLVVDANKDLTDDKIEIIRVPIVAGGTFRNPETTPKDVGLAILWGIHDALAPVHPSLRPKVQLMPDKNLQSAYADYESGIDRTVSPLYALIPPPTHIMF